MNATAPDQPLPAGTKIGNYTLHEEVGRGGMGSVYRATASDGSTVALKLLQSALTENETLLRRFQQEARLAARIKHPNVVRSIELGEEDGMHFFAMEFVDGESVGQRLKSIKRFPVREAVRVCVAVAEALDAAHQVGMIHRDVKPDNIMLTSDNQVKLTDMGLAKDTGDGDLNLTKTGRGLGTPHFMAPEQFKHAKSADVRCDVYSLGATLYMMVTGQLPFKAGNPLDAFIKKSQNEFTPPEEIVPNLPSRLVRVIKKAMYSDPKERPQDMRAFAAMLSQSIGSGDQPGDLPPDEPIWYVIYRDGDGGKKKVKGPINLLGQLIKSRKINSEAMVGKDKAGEFVPISTVPEFAGFLTTEGTTSGSRERKAEPRPPEQLVDTARASQASFNTLQERVIIPETVHVKRPFPIMMVVIAILAVAVLVFAAFVAGRMMSG